MTEYLTRFGALTLGGAIVIVLLWVTNLFPHTRYAVRWRCWGWLLLCLRLAVPLSLSAFIGTQTSSLIHIRVPSNPIMDQSQTDSPPAVPSHFSGIADSSGEAAEIPNTAPGPAVNLAPAQHVETAPAPAFLTLSELLFVLWLAGAVAVFVWNLGKHLRFLHYLRRWASPVTEEEILCLFRQLGKQMGLRRLPRLMFCQGLPTPMLAGMFRPCLLLPPGTMEGTALRHSLLHELSHFRRRDIPLKTLVLWVTALHWFNPAVWLMARTVEQDIELACDDAVLHRLAPEERAAYGETILQAADRTKR